MSLARRALAEGVGTFGFVFLGCASTVANVFPTGRFETVGIGLAHAAALGIFVAGTLGISGGHLNPAVTLGFLSTRRIDARTAGGYIAAQLVGAILAAFALKYSYPLTVTNISTLGTPALAGSVSFGRGIALEALGTFMLMSTVYGTIVGHDRPALGGLGVGIALLAIILAIGPATGGAVNPARALGPAIASGNLIGQAIYWIGPIVGAVAAAQLWDRMILRR
jgi:MIP family channel proteins